VFGISINAFVIYCILFRTKYSLGAYKYLQLIYILLGILNINAQVLIGEAIRASERDLYVRSLNVALEKVVIAGFLSLWSNYHLVIDYNFLYRLWVFKTPHRIRLFSTGWFILLLILVFIAFFMTWGATALWCFTPTDNGRVKIRNVLERKYGLDSMKQPMIMADFFQADGSWNVRMEVGMIIISSIFIFMAYAAANIVEFLRNTKLKSANSLRLQRQLFVLLCAQV
ncbi:hypothetical protein PMAYCL1PPCAC_14955, partial [Pristionchus mayeri]